VFCPNYLSPPNHLRQSGCLLAYALKGNLLRLFWHKRDLLEPFPFLISLIINYIVVIRVLILLGHGFGTVTDLQVGLDGYLYVLSYTNGAIYGIVPRQVIANQTVV
jgi:hypothetical protein